MFTSIAGMILVFIVFRLSYADSLNVPDFAKSIRQKELTKQTARKFTKKWFLEYWHGERSPYYAWLTWSFAILFLFIAPLEFIVLAIKNPSFFTEDTNLSQVQWDTSTLINIYNIFATVILWKCSKNASNFWKYLIRAIVIASFLIVFWGIVNPYFKT